MAINRISCPECGAGMKSATGFKVGKTVQCSKCEAEFEVAETAADDEEEEERPKKKKKKKKRDEQSEWSYRNSWIRYAILTVLIIVMCVLGYMLHLKREREAKASLDVETLTDRM